MAFSRGKRIEDETSERIVRLAFMIGCNEGTDALTVTRICKELNCDRRVIYNRFRDVEELNLIVARKCNEELIANAKKAINPEKSFYDNLTSFIQDVFTYVYEKNAFFQNYTALYQITEEGIGNEVLHELIQFIEQGKETGEVSSDTDSREAAESIWHILTGISRMLALNANYQYQDGLNTMLYGVRAVVSYMQKTKQI